MGGSENTSAALSRLVGLTSRVCAGRAVLRYHAPSRTRAAVNAAQHQSLGNGSAGRVNHRRPGVLEEQIRQFDRAILRATCSRGSPGVRPTGPRALRSLPMARARAVRCCWPPDKLPRIAIRASNSAIAGARRHSLHPASLTSAVGSCRATRSGERRYCRRRLSCG